jgi:hypothetical protein
LIDYHHQQKKVGAGSLTSRAPDLDANLYSDRQKMIDYPQKVTIQTASRWYNLLMTGKISVAQTAADISKVREYGDADSDAYANQLLDEAVRPQPKAAPPPAVAAKRWSWCPLL